MYFYIYRVGTLGPENFDEFKKHFKALALANKLHKHILVGDFNFKDVSWPGGSTTSELQQKFIDFLINDLGHTQLVENSTHKSGNTLDLIFTNIPNQIGNLKILDQNEFCLSDHFGMSFDINIDIKLKKLPKRKIYNYRKADWIGLNRVLGEVDWNKAFFLLMHSPPLAYLISVGPLLHFQRSTFTFLSGHFCHFYHLFLPFLVFFPSIF